MKNEPFLLMKQNENNNDDESDSSEDKNSKKDKKYKLKKYKKFRPKKNKNLELRTQIYLKGAENKVKSLLSLFRKDIEQ